MRKTKANALRPSFDELYAAEVFLHVLHSSGFTRAARILGKSTSTLSRVVAELERQLGTQLLARTTRKVHVTEAGALYAAHAERLLAAQRAARDAVAELTGGVPRGHLRVTMPVSVGERLLAPRLAELRARYPQLHLDIDLSDRVVPLVEAGFDLAIRVGRLADSSLRAQLLGKILVLLVASPRYLEQFGAPSHPDELARHQCLAVGGQGGSQEWTFHKPRSKPRRVEVDSVVHTNSPLLAAQLAAGGMGLLRIVEWVVRPELARGELVQVMPEWSCDAPDVGGVPVHVVYAQTASATPPLKSRVFVEVVKTMVQREGIAPRGSRRPPPAHGAS